MEEFAFLRSKIQKLQKSNQRVFQSQVSNDKSHVDESGSIHLQHNSLPFASKLRAYVDTILGTLMCRMDVQISDGHQMLLKYVTGYVAKYQDSFQLPGCLDT